MSERWRLVGLWGNFSFSFFLCCESLLGEVGVVARVVVNVRIGTLTVELEQ